jgi:hypothetical protein
LRRLELLITESRRATDNTTFSADTGIQDSEFIRYANDSVQRLRSRILRVYPNVFNPEKELDVTAGQESYQIPTTAFLGRRVEQVEYSRSGLSTDYYPLKKGFLHERHVGQAGTPSFYIRRDDQILLQPRPEGSGKIRVTFQLKPYRLDIRRGKVSAVSLGPSTISSLTLLSSELNADDATVMTDEAYISVVDKDGVLKMSSVPITAIDQTTGVVTVDTFSFESGETIAVGDYVVAGKFASNVANFPDECERYIVAHMDWKVLKRDSSSDSLEQSEELNDMLDDILQSYSEADADVVSVPIIDTQFIDADRW